MEQFPNVIEDMINEYANPIPCVMTLCIYVPIYITYFSFTHVKDFIKIHIYTTGIPKMDDCQYIKPDILYDFIYNELDDALNQVDADYKISFDRMSSWLRTSPSTTQECSLHFNPVKDLAIDEKKLKYCIKLFNNLYF